MKQLFVFLAFLPMICYSQSNNYSIARTAMMQGKFDTAHVLLAKVIGEEPTNIDAVKDQAYIYYLQRNFASARVSGEKMISFSTAGVDAYQLLGLIYKEIAAYKDADKLYRKGLEKFPGNAILLYEYGDLRANEKDYKEAVSLWEKSVVADPNYANNYYALTKYFFDQQQWIKAALLGETFVNIESLTKRTKEVRAMIADSYKQFFNAPKAFPAGFYQGVANGLLLSKKSNTLSPEILSATRTAFAKQWPKEKLSDQFAYRLFDYHLQMINEGIFDAYNQWLFDIDGSSFATWSIEHNKEAEKFAASQRSRMYKVPKGQYYQ
jgi:tetratricopeptide (TPR) repeat protein